MVKQATAASEAHAAADSADTTVSKFLDAVWMERGLSANTLAAYRADLTALARWLAERGTPIIKTTRADLLGFIAFRVEMGVMRVVLRRPGCVSCELVLFMLMVLPSCEGRHA